MKYEVVMGLEVHAQLLTKSKAFCACPNQFGVPPNTHICPVCTGQPGVLPVFNEEAASLTLLAAHALHCEVREESIFARKNYFYPDLPKGYQISQFDRPICEHGFLEVELENSTKKIGITRIHIEEDAGQLNHEGMYFASGVDLNRCGVPLMEIVSEPDFRSSEEVIAYLKQLREILIYIGVSDGNMQEGSFRCDVNVSIRLQGATELGTRTELKNMNSFRNIQDALAYEIQRQIKQVEKGEKIIQETLLWNLETQKTQSMRQKEDAHDYRYFPEPDLLPLILSPEWIQKQKENLPELPRAKRKRFVQEFELPSYDVELLCSQRALADFFEETVHHISNPKLVSNWLMRDVLGLLNERGQSIEQSQLRAEEFASLLLLSEARQVTPEQGREILQILLEKGGKADDVRKEMGFEVVSGDGALKEIIQQVLQNHPKDVEDYRSGNQKAFGALMGQARQQSGGNADMKKLGQLLREALQS